MTVLLCLIVAAYTVKATAVDVSAAVRGKPLPSQQRWAQRQKARERRRANPGYTARIWNNALDSWADASTKRHQRRMALREAREAERGPEWVEKKLAKDRKAAERREKFADRFGVLWGKARDAAADAHERRREDEAWAENIRRDAATDPTVPAGLVGSDHLDNEGSEGATVLPFPVRAEGDELQQAQPDSEDSATTDQPDTGQDTETNTQEEPQMSMQSVNTEITSLTDAITYTKSMADSLAQVDTQVEQWSADLRGLAEQARAASTELDSAVASLRNLGAEGHHLASLEATQEHLAAIADTFGTAAQQVDAASDSAQAGAAAFRQAHGTFTSQTGLQEHIQAAAASGNRAARREFYEMA